MYGLKLSAYSSVDAWSEVNSTLSEAYLGPWKTSKTQDFAKKIVNLFKPLNCLVKNPIDVW